ncbi:hypothetical protein HYS84_02790 [Candidatus Saccharibacteria bacterium]|nr:hypothetical protein [Candidatus Saccharibacteria bacterium]
MKPVDILKRFPVKRGVLVVAVAEPLSTFPQIYEIWIRHKSEGVSVLSWSLFAIAALIWLLYGLKIKDKLQLGKERGIFRNILWGSTRSAIGGSSRSHKL